MVYRIEERLSFPANRTSIDYYNQGRKAPLKSLMSRYFFSLKSIVSMILLTVSLLLLPLVLPPLPPPPLMLLLVPVAIMAVLIFLAVTPPQIPNVAFNSV
ncbi:hypothetical protein CDL12_09027 [Handroanthus impetiginosus]|uniref:Uncharacterized protein n=1 Tax=Handroanthus impetiginosus TaxID=429701 RepID=A0A2G9HLC2_9LAMI|nr:hypothetical protein CDL12_09027 [Handroanthus impetiginosus]